jgi:6-phosphogluconolactonase (cycloisomerase 2 family)
MLHLQRTCTGRFNEMLRLSALKVLLLAFAISDFSAAQVVTVASPANNSQFQSPAHYVATATSPQCPGGIVAMRIYLAPHVVAYKVQSNSVDTQLTLTPGNYKTIVQAWDACGGIGKTAVNFTVTPKGLKPVRFVYVADRFNRIFGLTADPVTGAVTPTAQRFVSLAFQALYIAADRGGHRLYATFRDSTFNLGGVYGYFIDRRNGYLSPVPGSPLQIANWQLGNLAVHSSGRFVFAAAFNPSSANGIFVFAVNDDGSLSAVNTNPVPTTNTITSLVVDRSGRYLYAISTPASIEAFAIDSLSGALTPLPGSPYTVSVPGGFTSAGDIADLYGRFLYTSDSNLVAGPALSGFAISGSTGTLTELPGSPFPFPLEYYAGSLATEPSGRFLYVDMDTDGNVAIYSINAGNGALTLVKPAFLHTGQNAELTSDPSGKFLYFLQNGGTGINKSGSVGAFAIDPVTGDLKLTVSPLDLAVPSTAWTLAVTP